MTCWLETQNGDKIPIQGNCSLGRDARSTIVLPGKLVSRQHSLIHVQGKSECIIVDLGSSNGTIVNGRRIRQPVELRDNDRLEIGENVLIFRTQDLPPPVDASVGTDTTSYQTIREARTAPHWLLIADIEKFTPLSQTMPGDQLGKLVGSWIKSCKEIIEKYNGEINKYLGDGYLAYWPSEHTPDKDIARALDELKILQAQHQQNAPKSFEFRLVLHVGAITIDNALSDGENALIGPEVNFVFRLEKLAGSLKQHVLVSKPAADRLKEYGNLTPHGTHKLSGFEGDFPVFSY